VFEGLTYVSPYEETAPPDLSQLSSGLILHISAASSVSPPPPGEVDTFDLLFRDLDPTNTTPTIVTFFAADGDFITVFDPDTGNTANVGPADILSAGGDAAYANCPEPSALALAGIGGACGILGLGWRRWRERRAAIG